MDQWKGKIAMVTGASSGIGASVAKSLALGGMTVVGLARRANAVEALSASLADGSHGGKIIARRCDVTVESDVTAAFAWTRETFGGIDVFVNNAGQMTPSFLIESDTEQFKAMFDLNVVAACVCTREAIRDMRSRSTNGHVFIINSVLGHRIPDVPLPLFNVYPATKYALTALCQTIKQELHFHKVPIKLTSISPGMVNTELLGGLQSPIYAALPKLEADDVAAALIYALSTPARVQINEIILEARLPYTE